MTVSPDPAAETSRLMGMYEDALDARAVCVVCGAVHGLVGHGTDCDIEIVAYGNETATACHDRHGECVLHSKMDYRKGQW